MVILDLIPHWFPSGSGASTLNLAAGASFLRGRPWIIFLGLALILFVVAGLKPAVGAGARSDRIVSAIAWGTLGVLMLIFAVYMAQHGEN
jgi:hypothetical protein